MKKDKHITVNFTDAEYNRITTKAEQEQRTLTATARLLILKALKEEQ